MPHKRSPLSLQRRAARWLVISHGRRDQLKAETVNILSREQIIEELAKQFEGVVLDAVKFERGEVLVDSRGSGSLQQLPKE